MRASLGLRAGGSSHDALERASGAAQVWARTGRVIYVQDPDFTLHVGDVRDVLRELEPESVDCAMTSPPFYALRDYGVDGQIGLEETPEQWADELVRVFREVRRVLKPEGTLWVECGDSYHGGGANPVGMSNIGRTGEARGGRGRADARAPIVGVKPKDLLGQPWLLAFALRADGWYLRQAIIWHKPNAMPESAKDRCTTAHSYVFLLSKQARYWFDAEAIAEPAEWARWGDQTTPKYDDTDGMAGSWIKARAKEALQSGAIRKGFRGEDTHETPYIEQTGPLINHGNRQTNGRKPRTDERRGFDNRLERVDGKKNPRSVWTIPTQGYPEAHFATWPEALCERIIKAGCPEGGTVLDPFMGSGTTGLVARRLGRKSVGIELNEEYARLAADRLSQLSLLAEFPASRAAAPEAMSTRKGTGS